MKYRFLAMLLLLPLTGQAADLVDATGRTIAVPEEVARVLPAGPPAAVLLEALAPDLMLGWPGGSKPATANDFLPAAAAALPAVPRVTGRKDVTADVIALKPDLIVDYGDVSPRYAKTDADIQLHTGVPTILLDGSLTHTPDALRVLGRALHREARAEVLAHLAETVLAGTPASGPHPSVVYARGKDGLNVAAPGTGVVEVFTLLGWRVLAPPGEGTFRQATLEQVAALDPDVLIFGDEGMREVIAGSPAWQALRAVRSGHASIAPATPFGWTEEPPSVNRLLGLAMLSQPGKDAAAVAAPLQATLYGRALSDAQVAAVRVVARPIAP
jgi:iron complex transport system substrate-binding protein